MTAAPETETDANGLRELLAAGFAAGWASVLDDDDAEFVQTDPQAMRTAYYYADLIAPTVERIVAERVRVVEDEREHWKRVAGSVREQAEGQQARAESAEAERDAALAEGEISGQMRHITAEMVRGDQPLEAKEEVIADLRARLSHAEAERDAAIDGALNLAHTYRVAGDEYLARAESAETKVARVKVLHEQWKAEGWDYAEGAIYDLSVALDECSGETDEKAESAEAAHEAEKAAHERLRADRDEAWRVAAQRRSEARRYYVAWQVARMRAQALRRLLGGGGER